MQQQQQKRLKQQLQAAAFDAEAAAAADEEKKNREKLSMDNFSKQANRGLRKIFGKLRGSSGTEPNRIFCVLIYAVNFTV